MNTLPPEYKNLPALSIRQPWAWMILNAGKDIENRTWITKFRGKFLIHASKATNELEWSFAKRYEKTARIKIPEYRSDDYKLGGIVGVADLVDCVTQSDSVWFEPCFRGVGFVLANVKPLQFIPCKGALKFFIPKIL